MTRKQIQQLVEKSYTNTSMNKEDVEHISSYLKRSELKEYVKELKSYEKKKTIVITSPLLPSKEDQTKIQDLFPKKKIVYDIDPSLLMGYKVTDNDVIYEYSLSHIFDSMLDHVENNYE